MSVHKPAPFLTFKQESLPNPNEVDFSAKRIALPLPPPDESRNVFIILGSELKRLPLDLISDEDRMRMWAIEQFPS